MTTPLTDAIALHVVDTRTGEARTIRVPHGEIEGSVSIGSDPGCNIVLAEEGLVAPKHAYYQRVGHHRYVEGPVRFFGRDRPEGTRVDSATFEIGPFQLHWVDPDPDAFAADVEGSDGVVR